MKCAACPVADGPCIVEATRHAPFCAWAEQGQPERIDLIRRWSREWATGNDVATASVVPLPPPADVLIVYRRVRAYHGLGVNATHTAACLARLGPTVRALPLDTLTDLDGEIGAGTIRLIVLQGRWAESAGVIGDLARAHPGVTFLVRVHSNLAFLQIEPTAFGHFRELVALGLPNLRLGAVSARLAGEFSEVYGLCVHLPNLYDLTTAPAWGTGKTPGANSGGFPAPIPEDQVISEDTERKKGPEDSGSFSGARPLRIAHFGAPRLQKHAVVGAMAALLIAKRLSRPLEFHINIKTEVGWTADPTMFRAIFAGLDWARLIEVPWTDPANFRRLVATMDLHFQLSASETFNICCADAAACGVPSVVSEAIDWAPSDCRAPIDDARTAAEVGLRLLADPTAGQRCRKALETHQAKAEAIWRRWLEGLGVLSPGGKPRYDSLDAQVHATQVCPGCRESADAAARARRDPGQIQY